MEAYHAGALLALHIPVIALGLLMRHLILSCYHLTTIETAHDLPLATLGLEVVLLLTSFYALTAPELALDHSLEAVVCKMPFESYMLHHGAAAGRASLLPQRTDFQVLVQCRSPQVWCVAIIWTQDYPLETLRGLVELNHISCQHTATRVTFQFPLAALGAHVNLERLCLHLSTTPDQQQQRYTQAMGGATKC